MKYLRRHGCFISLQLLLLFFTAISPIASGSPSITDPCDLQDSFMYCDCNILEPEEADIVTCNVYLNSSIDDPAWLSIQKLTSAVTFKIQLRRERLLNYFIPTQIFEKMRKLQYFYAKGGNIGTVPSFAFANSTSIDQIVLENNNISVLSPFAFANMLNMTHLDLADNSLHEINRNVFVNLPNLQHLSLDRNQITTIHDFAFSHLNMVEELDLQRNQLNVVTREVFAGLGKVKRLDLSHNSIQLLGDNVFSELKSLYDIDLMGNQIVSVSPTAFDDLSQVGRLNLRSNKLVEIHSTTFQPLFNLHFLDLRENQLEELNLAPIFKNFLTSGQLMVEGNRFKCHCQLDWIQNLYNLTQSQVIKIHLGYVECVMPPPQKYVRHTITATASQDEDATYFKSGHNFPPAVAVAVPQEHTTTYELYSVKQSVISLDFSKDLNCQSANSRRNRLSGSSTANPVQSPATLETPLHNNNPSKEQQHHSSGQSLISEKSNHHHHHQNDGQGPSHTARSSASNLNKFQTISFVLTILFPMLHGHNIFHA